mgnify:CR=1 FL=1
MKKKIALLFTLALCASLVGCGAKDTINEDVNAVDFIVDYRREEEVLPQPSSIIKLGSKGQVKVIR